MVSQNNTASEYDIWREVYGDIIEDTATHSEKMNIRRAVQYFAKLEENCDTLIQEQDDIIRGVMHKSAEANIDANTSARHRSKAAQPPGPGLISTADMPFDEFKKAAKTASKVVQKQMPMATNRFMRQAGSQQIDAIENLEIDIGAFRQHMSNVEVQILDTVPSNIDDVAAKLKFMSMLMLDGGEIEVDYFAYLVEECAEVIQDIQSTK